MKELKLVVDEHVEDGKDKVHVYGKVNPERNGESISVDIDVSSLPKTEVRHPGGGVSYADPLTANRTSGTSPRYIPGWSHAQLLNKEQNIWRKGHMVSEAFGGKGIEENMSIISQSVNSRMSSGPENFAKQETAKGKILVYKTEWDNHPTVGKIQNFAKNILVSITVKDGENITQKSFPFNNLSAPPSSVANIELHLNDLGEGMISNHFGVSLLFAREMILAKGGEPYSNIGNVARRMKFYYTNNGYVEGSAKLKKMYEELKSMRREMRNNSLLKIQ